MELEQVSLYWDGEISRRDCPRRKEWNVFFRLSFSSAAPFPLFLLLLLLSTLSHSHCNGGHVFLLSFLLHCRCTGWPFRLCQTSCWHQNKSSALVHGPHTKMELLFWCQQEVWRNLNGHPVGIVKVEGGWENVRCCAFFPSSPFQFSVHSVSVMLNSYREFMGRVAN